jgi:hypothetical protein
MFVPLVNVESTERFYKTLCEYQVNKTRLETSFSKQLDSDGDFLIRIRDIPGDNVGLGTQYPHWLPWLSSLCYNPEGRGFYSRWGHWIFFFNLPHPSIRAMALGSTKRVPGIFLGVKGGRRIRLTSPPSVRLYRKCGSLDVYKIWKHGHTTVRHTSFFYLISLHLNEFFQLSSSALIKSSKCSRLKLKLFLHQLVLWCSLQ